MKRVDWSRYVIGGLAVLVLVGLVAWLIRSEGERTRRMMREGRPPSEVGSQGVSQNRRDADAPPANLPGSASEARNATAASPPADVKKPAGSKPAAPDPRPGAAEDFSLDDHDVFPGLRPATKATSTK
jgi:hypothetical protein